MGVIHYQTKNFSCTASFLLMLLLRKLNQGQSSDLSTKLERAETRTQESWLPVPEVNHEARLFTIIIFPTVLRF